MNNKNFDYDVFVSYSRKDRSFVDFLTEILQSANLTFFKDTVDLEIFEKLDASLKAAISSSRYLMAIISPSYLQSYWCLFEAMEAIQGQDLALRFMPIVLRYNPSDQGLDEKFVLTALANLDREINEFERQLVATKAYELAPKLAKLQFVRQSLPGVFRQIHERIFPEFSLWDDDSIRSTLEQLLRRLLPDHGLDVRRLPLNFLRLPPTPTVVPALKQLPTVVWKSKVGHLARRNSPLVVGNSVFIGSAGTRWNEPDEADGVYCLDANNGDLQWFAHTPADANEVLVAKGIAITGCDDGTVVAFAVPDGSRLWTADLGSGVVGGPIKLPANTGDAAMRRSGQNIDDPVMVLTYNGDLVLFDLSTGRVLQRLSLGKSCLAEPAIVKLEPMLMFRESDGSSVTSSDRRAAVSGTSSESLADFFMADSIIVVALEDEVVTLGYSDVELRLVKLCEISFEGDTFPSCEPIITRGLVIQGIIRNTYEREPPLVAIELTTARRRWLATDKKGLGGQFGNLRSKPAAIGSEIIFATAYSDSLCAVAANTGKLLWRVPLGREMFEQWSGCIAVGQFVFLGRHDGYVHKVDAKNRRREWSLYLGNASRAGVAVSGEQDVPDLRDAPSWTSGDSYPILSEPTWDRDRLYVGTEEGYLYCVSDAGGS